MVMMEQQQSDGSVRCDGLPPLSAKHPWLVVQNAEDNFGNQVFHNLHKPLSQYCYQIPELVGRRIRGFFHGWVILSNKVMWSLWNPSNSKVIRLPPLRILNDGDYDDGIIGQCCLTSPLGDPGSILLLTRTDRPTFVFCRLDCERKKLKWTEMSYAKQLKRINNDGGLLHSLTCCDGKVYALNTGGCLFDAIIIIDIVVKGKEVVLKLLLFGPAPLPDEEYFSGSRIETTFLTGSSTVLFFVAVGFIELTWKTINYVTLFKLDTTTVNWEDIHNVVSKEWDMTGMSEIDDTNWDKLMITDEMWEEVSDLKDAIFFVDLALDNSVFYLPAIDSELGGYIHIRGKTGTIHSYHIKDRTLSPSYMPSPLPSTSHVSLWEGKRLKGGYVDYKIEEVDKDDGIIITSVMDDEVEFNESHLLNLSTHLLELIMEHCAGVEYMKFRATCKQCLSAAPLIKWRDKSGVTRLQNYSLVSPWLMVVDKEQGIITFTDPLFGDKYFMKNIPLTIYTKAVFCSRFGWLLLFLNNSTPAFYNPFTSDVRKLPPIEYLIADSFSFSAPPTSPDCMVVGFSCHIDWDVHIHFVAREFSWQMLRLRFDAPYTFRFPTFYGQDLYALCKDKLHVFKDLGVDDYSWEKDVAEAPKSCCTSPAKHFLTKQDQYLLLVIVCEESVEVFKFNDNTKTWGKVDGLGHHMIYISEETCLCVEAKTPEMENKIYFSELLSRNGRILFYSLETCTYGTFNNKTSEVSHTIVRQLHHPCTWIEPSWS